MKLGIVEWEDIKTYYGWRDVSDIDEAECARCICVGLIKEFPDVIKVIQNMDINNRDPLVITVIPRGVVKRIRYLRIKD